MLMITEMSWRLRLAGEQMVYINIIQWVCDRTAAHLIFTAMLGYGLEKGLNFSSIRLINSSFHFLQVCPTVANNVMNFKNKR